MSVSVPDPIGRLSRLLNKGSGQISDFTISKRLIPCSVLIIIFKKGRQFYLLLTRRSSKVLSHAGQVGLPGGHYEAGDRTLRFTAIREVQEELGITVKPHHVLGHLPPVRTITGYWILPFVAFWSRRPPVLIDRNEVESCFSVSLSAIFEESRWKRENYRYRNRPISIEVFCYRNIPVWGATARILKRLTQKLRQARF